MAGRVWPLGGDLEEREGLKGLNQKVNYTPGTKQKVYIDNINE